MTQPGSLCLPLARYRLTARFQSDLPLPDYAGSLLRSVFGLALRETACMTREPDCKSCALWRSCSYPAIFETPPRPTQFGQQFSAVPNPYVIEPPLLGTNLIPAGEPLVFHIVLAGEASIGQLPLVVHAWQRALRQGIGPSRVQGRLVDLAMVNPDGTATGIWQADAERVLPHVAEFSLAPAPAGNRANLRLSIHTPLRLQHNGHPINVHALTPRVLVSHLLRRINLMLDLHMGIRPVPFDFKHLVALAEQIVDDRSGLRWHDWTRYSARQQQSMTLGGVVGRWTLHGDLTPLIPWLALGEWLHVGKNASMGMGGYEITDVLDDSATQPNDDLRR